MKNLFIIDLTKHNHNKIVSIFEKLKEKYNLNISIGMVLVNKDEGFKKLWIDLETETILYYTTKRNPDVIKMTSDMKNSLNKLGENHDEFIDEPIELNADAILEKISKKGIDSITKAERDFLDNLK